MMRFSFTAHAIERYRSRIAPGADSQRALSDGITSAAPLKERTYRGQQVWKVTYPVPMRWVTKPDNGLHIVVTVLEPEADAERAVADYLAELEEYYAGGTALAELTGSEPGRQEPTAEVPEPGKDRGRWYTTEQKRLSVDERQARTLAEVDVVNQGGDEAESTYSVRATQDDICLRAVLPEEVKHRRDDGAVTLLHRMFRAAPSRDTQIAKLQAIAYEYATTTTSQNSRVVEHVLQLCRDEVAAGRPLPATVDEVRRLVESAYVRTCLPDRFWSADPDPAALVAALEAVTGGTPS